MRHVELQVVAPGVHCLGPRGLTQTNIYFVSTGQTWVLVDAGWARDGARIRQAAAALFGTQPPSAIVLTHDHPDHEGQALQLARGWGCPVYLALLEMPIALRDFAAMHEMAGPLDRWLVLPLMRLIGRRRREAAFARSSLRDVVRAFDPATGVPALPGWTCVPTPGHTPGHVAFFRESDRVLLAGDALVTARLNSPVALLLGKAGLSEPPWYFTWSRAESRRSIDTIARLRPNVVAGGHGQPMAGPATADFVARFALARGSATRRSSLWRSRLNRSQTFVPGTVPERLMGRVRTAPNS
jgi:glyoxylase-like metal-dependent hydrolase (beta-lactamase superfamily II)